MGAWAPTHRLAFDCMFFKARSGFLGLRRSSFRAISACLETSELFRSSCAVAMSIWALLGTAGLRSGRVEADLLRLRKLVAVEIGD